MVHPVGACPGATRPLVSAGRVRERAARVALAHDDQLLEELGIEEQVAEQLAVGGALPAEQLGQQPQGG
jgi:hypothetical protein